jgi:dCTP deaminase
MCREQGMISPFEERLLREVDGRRIISAGVSSYGYDLRLAEDGFRVFSPIVGAEIRSEKFDEATLIEAPLRTARMARVIGSAAAFVCVGCNGRDV